MEVVPAAAVKCVLPVFGENDAFFIGVFEAEIDV
jgi:hypothetical protein